MRNGGELGVVVCDFVNQERQSAQAPGWGKEKLMGARKVAVQFAAYVWFENVQGAKRSDEEKARFTRKNWRPFLPIEGKERGSPGRKGRPNWNWCRIGSPKDATPITPHVLE